VKDDELVTLIARARGLMQTLREDIRAKASWNYEADGPGRC